MTDQLHDIRNLISSHNASSLAFYDHLTGHFVFLCLKYCRLVQANRGGMYAHVAKYDVRIVHSCW